MHEFHCYAELIGEFVEGVLHAVNDLSAALWYRYRMSEVLVREESVQTKIPPKEHVFSPDLLEGELWREGADEMDRS